MFTESIRQTPITDPVAEGVFGHIHCYDCDGDNTLCATMRALFYDRFPTDAELTAHVNIMGNDSACRSGRSLEEVMDFRTNHLNITSLTGSKEQNTNIFNYIDEHVIEGGDVKLLKDVQQYFDQLGVRVRVLVQQITNTCSIAIEFLTTKKYHMLQSLMPRYFPALFGEGHKLTDWERALMKSLMEKSSADYLRLITEFAERFDFRSMRIRNQLQGFEKSLYTSQLSAKEAEVQLTQNHINDLYERIAEYREQLLSQNIYLAGLKAMIADDSVVENELMDYFLASKGLELVSLHGNDLTFTVETTLSNFDPDVFEKNIENKSSVLYSYQRNGWTKERLRLLLNAIFTDERLKWRVCGAYKLNFVRGSLSALSGYSYNDSILSTHLPNQHLQRYSCLGTYETQIHNAVDSFDYVGAVSLCCASAANINFSDSIVTEKFMQELTNSSAKKFIELPDGSAVTPLKAVEWLEKEEGSDE